MTEYQHLRVTQDARGVLTVRFDLADRTVNVFGEELVGELSHLVNALSQEPSARLVVFRSAKESGFVVGADVHRIVDMPADEAETAIRFGQELFQQVAGLPMPTIAAIHGNCLGGGLEFALACDCRIARDDSTTRLGLPEIQLGLLPGWGGTQRLPRQVGLQKAIQMILTGSPLSAQKALQANLVDAVSDTEQFDAAIADLVERLMNQDRPQRRPSRWHKRLMDETAIGRAIVLRMARRRIEKQARHYPALPASLRAIETGLREGIESGLLCERKEFCQLLFTPTCRNLLGLFLQRERARSLQTWVSCAPEEVRPLTTIGVVGGGTMGAGIAQLAATQGFRVVVKEVDERLAAQAMERIESLLQKGVRKGALRSTDAKSALAAITATSDWGPLQEADLVIEAVVERMEVKQAIFRDLDAQLPPGALLTSNTSSLSIAGVAAVTNRADRVAGVHFFNPVHRMPLVEVVRTSETSDLTIASLIEVVRTLGKTPLVVADAPGFLVNRVLFPYLDEAVRLVTEGVPIAEVDREAKRFGLPMGPLQLLDTVGIDVAADVAGSLPVLGQEETPTPGFLAELAAQGRLGEKSGRGFYEYRKGRRGRPYTSNRAVGKSQQIPDTIEIGGEKLSGIQQRLIFSLVNAAAGCVQQRIVREPWMADLGMVLGTGFAPFRGGPLQLANTWGSDTVVRSLEFLTDLCGARFQPSEYFADPTSRIRAEHGS